MEKNIYIAQVCGVDMPTSTTSKNLHRKLYFNIEKLESKNNIFNKIKNLEVKTWGNYIDSLESLPEIWLRRAINNADNIIVKDTTGTSLTGYQFATASLVMSNKLNKITKGQQNIGVCLPTSVGGYLALLGLLMAGKSIVNLNYTSSTDALKHAIASADISTIITSKAFVLKLAKKGFYVEEIFSSCNIVYLEDIKKQISKLDFIKQYMAVKFLHIDTVIRKNIVKIDNSSTAFILFSSGSEGLPKGVVLTYKNILGNIYQSSCVVELKKSDVFAGILPVFHAFGLTISLLSFLQGNLMICHPDPTDAKSIANIIKENKISILCATPTFLRIYSKSRAVKKDDLQSIRLIVAGAEKLSNEVRNMFEKKFDKTINEGYGATELSPVCAVNRTETMPNKIGTVGNVVPGGEFKIIDPDTYQELETDQEGMIIYRGVNKMKCYLNDEVKTSKVLVNINNDNWYITGDKGRLDEQGYLTIVDRYSRFAKIAGEMISLGALESSIYEVLKENNYNSEELDFEIIAIATSDPKRGEIINLLYTLELVDDKEMKSIIKSSTISNLYKPTNYFLVQELPKLGSGKINYAETKKVTHYLVQNHNL